MKTLRILELKNHYKAYVNRFWTEYYRNGLTAKTKALSKMIALLEEKHQNINFPEY